MFRINKVYTKAGDQGKTQLIGGDKVYKNHARIECYGTIDELNANLGMLVAALDNTSAQAALVPKLLRIQNELFNLGTQLATPEAKRRSAMPDIFLKNISFLERDIDSLNEELPELQSFVLPGGSFVSACAHLARTVCRRAERQLVGFMESEEGAVDLKHVIYLNRLSDALFVFGRYSLCADKIPEQLWKPDQV